MSFLYKKKSSKEYTPRVLPYVSIFHQDFMKSSELQRWRTELALPIIVIVFSHNSEILDDVILLFNILIKWIVIQRVISCPPVQSDDSTLTINIHWTSVYLTNNIMHFINRVPKRHRYTLKSRFRNVFQQCPEARRKK